MRELLERTITIRLSAETYSRNAEAAARIGIPLSTYLRQRVERGDEVSDQLEQLRLAIVDREDSEASIDLRAVLFELILLARQNARPADRLAVEQAMQQHALRPWNPQRLPDAID